jgi:hypothetical protein
MFRDSIVQRSGQLWKLTAGLLSQCIGFGIMVVGLRSLDDPHGFTLTVIGFGTGITAFAAMCAAIRCPVCGMKWFWVAVRTQEHAQWVNWLRTRRVCPQCGHNGTG